MKPKMTVFVLTVALVMALSALPGLSKGKPAHAGGPSEKTTNDWVQLDQQDPSHGDTVTFSVSDTDSWVRLRCFQGGELVAELSHNMSPNYPWDAVYTLWSPSWPSGAGECEADMGHYAKNGRFKVAASTSFFVSP